MGRKLGIYDIWRVEHGPNPEIISDGEAAETAQLLLLFRRVT